ncbi:superinfection immunity protein [Thalassotalea sp. HSM 43]|uniref:superinfection immunity protein n=1 Tax=Thalassotalea sp. HSM 43 TaxID=2552945 RepID=UPI001E5A310C|nr:superinfection immunity protein [Thalassotalea sp. HSM 43]
MESMTQVLDSTWQQQNYLLLAIVFLAMLVLWFLPALLALVFNRKQFKYILLACVPAGLSMLAWGGVLVWAVSGKIREVKPDSQ